MHIVHCSIQFVVVYYTIVDLNQVINIKHSTARFWILLAYIKLVLCYEMMKHLSERIEALGSKKCKTAADRTGQVKESFDDLRNKLICPLAES